MFSKMIVIYIFENTDLGKTCVGTGISNKFVHPNNNNLFLSHNSVQVSLLWLYYITKEVALLS